MGLKQIFQRWSKGKDVRALERATEESQMTKSERDARHEDFEARKDDIAATRGPAGSAAADAASEDLA